MPPPTTPFEVDVRRSSAQSVLEKLERTMGVRFNVRRARVTSKRSQWYLEIVEGAGTPPQYP